MENKEPFYQIIESLRSTEELAIKKLAFQAYFTLKDIETLKEYTSVLPIDHHLDTSRILELLNYLRLKINE